MSSLPNGTEDMVGQNLTPGAAYPVVNAALQKLAVMNLHEQVIPFYGLCRDNQQRGKSAIAVERHVVAIEIRVEGDPPTGGSFTIQLVINGVLQSQQASVSAAGTYSLTNVASGNWIVPANQTAEIKIVSANSASDAIVTLKSQLRIL
jgi:hypothetical protein